MSIINCIKTNLADAIVYRCSEKNCKLKLNGLDNYVILKGEKFCLNKKICDCIIFKMNELLLIGIIELKSKTVHVNEIVEKLSNGSEFALKALEKCKNNFTKFKFYHIVLSQRLDSSEYKVITKRKIIVRGKKYNIIPKRCGVSFSDIIAFFEM